MRSTGEVMGAAEPVGQAIAKAFSAAGNELPVSGRLFISVNTPLGRDSHIDERAIRTEAVAHGVPCITTLEGASAAADGIRAMQDGALQVKSLQEYHGDQFPVQRADRSAS
jgi:carbamoyl-phosphate synthase large subunit